MNMTTKPKMDYLALARRVFEIEANAVAGLADKLDANFSAAVQHILQSSGRVIICGMGKSGLIGKKLAATLASTGTPSFSMHPGEAFHGDLGMVTSEDIFLAISNSGETDEVIKLLPFLRDNGNFLIALTGNSISTLARAANCHLDVGVAKEACPLLLAPTASTTAALAMGDALAVTLMEARNFKPENFARFHPGGTLGRRLLGKVEHEMLSVNLPLISEDSQTIDIIHAITQSTLGIAIVKNGCHYSIITDGDLRRALERFGKGIFDVSAKELMTSNPTRVTIGTRIEDALIIMLNKGISSLLVFDGDILVGVFKK
jgi:arabinose-5-phosphate isomerase